MFLCSKSDEETLVLWLMADDEDDMLEHYLAEKTDSSSHSSKRETN